MAKQSIDLGSTPNDGTGSNLRVGGDIINDNFNEVYTTLGDGSDLAFDITGVSNGQTLVYNSSTSKFEAGTAAGGSFTLRDSSSTTQLISDSDILNVVGSGGITATVSATDTLTIAAGSSIATLTGSQVLQNKTIDTANNTITVVEADISDLGSYITATSSDVLQNKTISGSSNTLSNIANSSLTNSFITINGTSISLGNSGTISAGTDWQTGVVADGSTVTAAAAGEGYFIDTTSFAHTLQLPASPTIGDEISIIDVAGTFDTNSLTVDRNGKPIAGAASNLTVSVERAGFTLVFYDNTQGWVLKNK